MKVEFQKDLIKLAGNIGKKTDYLKQYFQELSNIYDCVMEKVIHSVIIYDELTGELKKQYGEVLDYFKSKQQQIAESSLKIANLLQHPEIFEECCAFNELLRTQYSFNEMLRSIVERQLAFNSYPDLKNIENEIEENYLNGRISIYQANEQLAEKIKSLMGLNELQYEI
ncbi:MAG: hypothetical protein H0T62_02625 [Parachlamydiaceae bacterium]|nr:hypothetical protein [Parachlamydiaceae bacterium]